MKRTWPYLPDDLRYIADRVEKVLGDVAPGGGDLEDGDWRWGLSVTIWNPDGDEDDIAGTILPYGDGWLGFYPKAIDHD